MEDRLIRPRGFLGRSCRRCTRGESSVTASRPSTADFLDRGKIGDQFLQAPWAHRLRSLLNRRLSNMPLPFPVLLRASETLRRRSSRLSCSMTLQDCGSQTPHPLLPIHGGEIGMCLTLDLKFSLASANGECPQDFHRHRSWIVGFCWGQHGSRGLHVRPGRAEWIWKKNCSTRWTGSCMKTFPILSTSTV